MAANELHLGDVSTAIRCTIKDNTTAVNISSATVKQLIFTKPNSTSSTQDAAFYTNGTDGVIQFVTTSGFLDQIGMWQVQGYIEMNSGKWSSDVKKFRVHRNL